jgi:glycosyltransferase involved in cell wall biosynthesis
VRSNAHWLAVVGIDFESLSPGHGGPDVHIIGLVDSPDHVCSRYRLRAFRDEFTRAGHTLELRSLPTTWYGKFCIGTDLGHADAVILQRRLLPGWQRRLLRRSVRWLIFDFDDAIFGRDSYSDRNFDSPRRWRRFAATVRQCDAVVAGNHWLKDRAVSAGARGSATTIPTCVDTASYQLSSHASTDGVVRLVWVGSSSTLQSLERIRGLLDSIGRASVGVRLRMICDRYLQFANLPVEECRWDPATEALAIAGADIGVSWTPDDDWSRGKCGLKVLQYMAAGLPVIANDVGVQTELVEHGVTGFLARTDAEWVSAVRKLAGDATLRRRMGAAGHARVEREFSLAAGGRLWRELLDEMARPKRIAS